jgi:hypothetical protein
MEGQTKNIAVEVVKAEINKKIQPVENVTSDATPTVIFSITPNDFSTGCFMVFIAASWQDGTSIAGLTSIQAVRYKKTEDVTLGTVTDVLPIEIDTELSGAAIAISASGGDILFTATGIADFVKWELQVMETRSISELIEP